MAQGRRERFRGDWYEDERSRREQGLGPGREFGGHQDYARGGDEYGPGRGGSSGWGGEGDYYGTRYGRSESPAQGSGQWSGQGQWPGQRGGEREREHHGYGGQSYSDEFSGGYGQGYGRDYGRGGEGRGYSGGASQSSSGPSGYMGGYSSGSGSYGYGQEGYGGRAGQYGGEGYWGGRTAQQGGGWSAGPGQFGGQYGGGQYGGGQYGRQGGYGEYAGEGEQRGMWDRTSDEVSSWFGDEEARRRREMDQMQSRSGGPYGSASYGYGGQYGGGYAGYGPGGRGPKGYKRSDTRIHEDVCDRLGGSWSLDASDIEVQVKEGEVTLMGAVKSRQDRRRAEDCIEYVPGVKHVQNNLRVKDQAPSPTSSSDQTGGMTGRGGTTFGPGTSSSSRSS
jgi:osmotically-inducible protein OsmY